MNFFVHAEAVSQVHAAVLSDALAGGECTWHREINDGASFWKKNASHPLSRALYEICSLARQPAEDVFRIPPVCRCQSENGDEVCDVRRDNGQGDVASENGVFLLISWIYGRARAYVGLLMLKS